MAPPMEPEELRGWSRNAHCSQEPEGTFLLTSSSAKHPRQQKLHCEPSHPTVLSWRLGAPGVLHREHVQSLAWPPDLWPPVTSFVGDPEISPPGTDRGQWHSVSRTSSRSLRSLDSTSLTTLVPLSPSPLLWSLLD